jgi:hypothetical protein
MRRNAMLCLVLSAVLPCHPLHAQVPAWQVSARPVTVIGVVDGPPDQEIVNVSAARRLADGRVVVANGKPLELRLYDPTGKFLNRISRKGQGPGEYQGLLAILPSRGDSVVVYDRGNGRINRFAPTGKLLHEAQVEESARFDGGVVLFRRSLIYGMPVSESGCLKQMLTKLPLPTPPNIREVHADGAGHFWVRGQPATSWMVYSSAGTALGRVTLPVGFTLYQVGLDFVVGKRLIEDDIEQVQVLRVVAPAPVSASACRIPGDTFPDVKSERATVMTRALRDAMTAGEVAFSDWAHYVGSLDSLGDYRKKLPAETAFTGFLVSNRGWGAMIFDTRSTVTCAFGLGSAALPGWRDGAMICRE